MNAYDMNLRALLPVQPEGRHADYWRGAHMNARVHVASGTSSFLFGLISPSCFLLSKMSCIHEYVDPYAAPRFALRCGQHTLRHRLQFSLY